MPLHPSRVRLESGRLNELLDIAAEVFTQKGFSAASTNEIARLANASKGTFYSRFPTKEALFSAVLERRMREVFQRVAGALPPDAPIEDTLFDFGKRVLDVALSSDQLALMRVVGMEGIKFPRLAQTYYDLGPGQGQSALTAYMTGQITLGRLADEDPVVMAQQYLSLLGGGAVRWAVLGISSLPTGAKQRDEHVHAALRTFLRAFQSRPAKDSKGAS